MLIFDYTILKRYFGVKKKNVLIVLLGVHACLPPPPHTHTQYFGRYRHLVSLNLLSYPIICIHITLRCL